MTLTSTNLYSWIHFSSRNQQKHRFWSTAKSNIITLKKVKCTVSSVKRNGPGESNEGRFYCPYCSKKHHLGALFKTGLLPICPSLASGKGYNSCDPMEILNKFHPPRPDWYEELFASAMDKMMDSYEAEIAGYKSQLFSNLRGNAKNILEIGIGTGPNLRYYADYPDINIFGVDPNKKMEKYVKAAAENARIAPSNFEFMQAVGEALPLNDASFDVVIGTLVLCSVTDVDLTLQEVKRVLKPGGIYIFVEHVAGKDGTILKYIQGILNPLQKTICDGCHLTRNTLKNISGAGFSNVDINEIFVSTFPHKTPHIYGIARR